MLRLFGIRPNRFLIALAGVALLVAGLVMHHGLGLTVLGAALIVYSAAVLVAGRRRGAR
jgi:membrane protein implicated in regulation of membrane protease activity